MAIYFDIVLSMKNMLSKMQELNMDDSVALFIEYRSQQDPTLINYQELPIAPEVFHGFNLEDFVYHGVFMISREVHFDGTTSPYSDELFPYCIELKGEQETETEIEKIKCRQIAKQPASSISKAYQKLQRHLKKETYIRKGVYWGEHFYKNIYFDHRITKTIWGDFNQKDEPIRISET